MSPESKILLKEHTEEFDGFAAYMRQNPWIDDVGLNQQLTKLESTKLNVESSIISTMLSALKKFKEDVGDDYPLKPIQNFIKKSTSTIQMHLDRIDRYNREWPINDESSELEVKFRSELFAKKTTVKVAVSKLNVVEKEVANRSLKLFYGDNPDQGKYIKAPLLMREMLCDVMPVIKDRTDALGIDFNAFHTNPATSNEMLINMRPQDIPEWDIKKHFFEQEKSTIEFWEEEIRKCKNGINVGGYFVHPWLYWHLNIFKLSFGVGQDKLPKSPDFRDNEYFFTEMLKQAEDNGRVGLFMYGSRRFSKSVVATSYLNKAQSLIRNAKVTIIGFSKTPDLDALVNYTNENITNMHPAMRINANSLDLDEGIILGLKKSAQERLDYSDTTFVNLEAGSKKGNQKPAAGTPDAFAMDEVAKGPCIEPWEAAKPSFAGGLNGRWRLTPLLLGTAGNEALSKDAELMLKNPHSYDILPMNWDTLEKHIDPEHITWKRQTFGFFVPAQLSLEGPDKEETTFGEFLGKEKNNPLHKLKFYATNWQKAKEFFEDRRKDKEADITTLSKYKNSFPLDPEDCYITTEENPFPGLEAKKRKDFILEQGVSGRKVRFYKDGYGGVRAQDTNDSVITDYPFKGGNIDAPPVILYNPYTKSDTPPPLGLIVCGLDDAKQNTSDGDSVLSATFFMRGYEGGEWANRVVGWYDTRPSDKKVFYKELYLMIKFFNARILHENEDNGFIDWMETNHIEDVFEHVSDGVGLASEENMNRNKNRKWGWSPTLLNIYHLMQKVIAYTKQDGLIVGEEVGLTGIDVINHPMLLDEMYRFKKKQNADRIRSFGLSLLLASYYDKTFQYMKRARYTKSEESDTLKKNKIKKMKGLTDTSKLVKF